MKPPLYRWQGSLFWWVGALCFREVDRCCHSSWYRGYLPISLPPVFCLALPTMTQVHDWSHSSWGSLSASINRHWHHSLCLCTCSFQSLQPHHVTWDLHPSSVDALVEIHGRSCNFPFFHPREALLVGHWVTSLSLSSCNVLFLSPLAEVVLHGVGLVHLSHVWWLPIHKGTPISDMMRRSQFWWRTHDFVRGDISCELMHHLPSLFFPPIPDLPLSLKSIHIH